MIAADGASFDSRSKGRKGSRRRLRKKYQTVGSDDENSLHDQFKDIDNEDILPISSFYKNKASGRASDQEMDDSVDKGAGDAGKDGGNTITKTDCETDTDNRKCVSRCLFSTETIQMPRCLFSILNHCSNTCLLFSVFYSKTAIHLHTNCNTFTRLIIIRKCSCSIITFSFS